MNENNGDRIRRFWKVNVFSQAWQMLDIPVYHLDAYYWKPGWVATPNEEWDLFLERLVLKEAWIMDGHYGRTLDARMTAADVIIFIDLSPWITTYRVLKRRIQCNGKTRPDLNEGCPESIDWPFLKWVWNFRKTRRPGITELLRKHSNHAKINVLQTRKEVDSWIESLYRNCDSYYKKDNL